MRSPSNPTSSYARLPIKHARLTACILAMMILLLLSPCATQAAVVLLKNGDRITGRIVKMEKQRLEIDPDFSDIIKIKWEDVQSITSERPMSIKLYGEVDIPENAGERRLDRLIVSTLGGEGGISLEDVRAINFAENDYRGYLSGGGNQTSGNSQTTALNVSGNLMYRRLEHRYILDGKYNRGQADGEDTANNGAFNVKYNYFLTRRVYMGGFDLVETDQFQNLTLRNTGGLLLGYDILDREHHNLTIAAGPAAVYQDFTTDPATLAPAASGTLRYEFMFRGDDVVFFHKSQAFKDLGHGSATRVNADQGMRVRITQNWRVNFEYDIRYNSLPVAGRQSVDTNIIFGFSYDLKP
jgi:putative salt-induced outer membrane protein YdiY